MATKTNEMKLLDKNKEAKNMDTKMANGFEPTIKNEEETEMDKIYEMATGAHASRNQQIETMDIYDLLLEVKPETFTKGNYGLDQNCWLEEMKGLVGEALLGYDESKNWKWNPEQMANLLENILKEILKIENDMERDGYINVMIYLVDYKNINLECEIYEFLDFVNDIYEI